MFSFDLNTQAGFQNGFIDQRNVETWNESV